MRTRRALSRSLHRDMQHIGLLMYRAVLVRHSGLVEVKFDARHRASKSRYSSHARRRSLQSVPAPCSNIGGQALRLRALSDSCYSPLQYRIYAWTVIKLCRHTLLALRQVVQTIRPYRTRCHTDPSGSRRVGMILPSACTSPTSSKPSGNSVSRLVRVGSWASAVGVGVC